MTRFDLRSAPLDGIHLIDASAGTGKTFTLEGLVVRLILEKQLKIENILVVTFTEAATNELKERILKKLRASHAVLSNLNTEPALDEDPFSRDLRSAYSVLDEETIARSNDSLKLAIETFDESLIFTIHGFCQRLLIDFAFETGSPFEMEITTSVKSHAQEITEDYWRNLFYQSVSPVTSLLLNDFPTPSRLYSLYQKIASQLDLRLEPVLENPTPAYWLDKTEEAFVAAKDIWLEQRSEIESLFTMDTFYRLDWLNGRMKAVDTLFHASQIDENKLKWFYQTTISEHAAKKNKTILKHSFFSKIEKFIKYYNTLLVCIKTDFIHHIKSTIRSETRLLNLRSFDDLLLDVYLAIKSDKRSALIPRIRARYQAALIDEFQDTDPIQYEIFHRLFGTGSSPLFLIGDPKQSIYQFRGADIFTYCRAKRFVQERDRERVYHLNVNYRSSEGLVKAVNTIFENSKLPFINEEIPFIPSESGAKNVDIHPNSQKNSPFQLWFIKSRDKKPVSVGDANTLIAAACSSEIVKLLNRQPSVEHGGESILPQDICVLARSHKEALLIQRALIKKRVPHVISTRRSIFQSNEYYDVLCLLEAVVYYQSPELIRRALIGGIIAYSGNRVHEINISDEQWDAVSDRFYQYHQLWNRRGVFYLLRTAITEFEVKRRLLSLSGGERELTNLLHSVELFHQAETTQKFTPISLINWGRQQISKEPDESEEEIRLETDENAVKIMTIHVSKGLEFPYVFCPFSWKGSTSGEVIFHQNDTLVLDLGSKEKKKNRESADNEALAESIRLLYVALTRAKRGCYLIWGNLNKTNNSPLSYLFHQGRLKDKDLWSDLEELCKKSDGTISLSLLPKESEEIYTPPRGTDLKLEKRVFSGNTNAIRCVSSYSSLTKKLEYDAGQKDRDALIKKIPEEANLGDKYDAFHLPRGSTTGICIHEIFEEIDFREKPEINERVIRSKLRKYGIESEWVTTVRELVETTLGQKLVGDFQLSDLSLKKRMSELEFYFPIRRIQMEELLSDSKFNCQTAEARQLKETLKTLSFKSTSGFMKGYIDMVFPVDNRYYIIDWKTNYLGNRFEDYSTDRLESYMISQGYNFQFYVYSLALHKYLATRIPDYQFSKSIGGVFYLFLRGISSKEGTGIYFKNLENSFDIINQLDDFFCGSDENH